MCINWENPIEKLEKCKKGHFDMNSKKEIRKNLKKVPKINFKKCMEIQIAKKHKQIPKRNAKRTKKHVLQKWYEKGEFPFSATLFIETENIKAWERDWTWVCLDGAVKIALAYSNDNVAFFNWFW